MPKLSIDIGVDLKDSLNKLNGLKSALMDVEKTANNLVSSLQKINGVKINPKVGEVGGGQAASPSQPRATKLPDIFSDYNSGAIKASSLTDFLEAKLVSLQAEANKLRATLSQTQDTGVYTATLQKLKEVESQIKRTTAALGAQAPTFRNTTSSYTVFNAALDKQRQVANLANLSLVNVGRVFQDLPFGILGIANNLNPLIEGFSQLAQTAKSTGQSLGKALLSSLAGPGGLAVGFSLVTAALSFASVGLSYWTRESKKAKEKTDEFKKSLDSIRANTAKEATDVSALVAVINSEVETRERKNAALKELQRINPDIFKGLSIEKSGIDGINTAYKAYLDNLKTVIAVQEKKLRLEKVLKEIIDLEGSALTKNEQAVQNAFKQTTQLQAEGLKNLGAEGAQAARQVTAISDNIEKTKTNKLKELQKLAKDLVSDIDELSKGIKLDIEDPKAAKDSVKRNKDIRTFAEAVAEIKDDIFKIQSKPLLTDAEKNVAIANLLKSSLDKLADDFPNQFRASLFQVGGDVRKFTDELSKTELKVFSDATLKNAKDFSDALTNIKLDEELTGLDKTNALLNVSLNALKGFRKEKEDLLSTPFRLEGLPQFAKAFFEIDNNIKNASSAVTFFQEQIRQQKIADIFQGASDKAKEFDREFRALDKNLRLDKRIKLRIETDKKSLDDIQKRIAELNLLKVNPLDPEFIKLLKQEQNLIFKIQADTESLKFIEDQAQLVKESLTDTFADVGDAIGSALSEGTDVAAAIGKTVLENLGNFLQQIGKQFIAASKLIQTASALIATPLGLLAGVALVALGALVKGIAAKGFADGGFVSGPGGSRSDSIPARLSNGEYVINAKSVRKYGKGFFDNLNAGTGRFNSQFGGAMRFADGGLVTREMSRAIVNRSDIGVPDMGGFVAETKISGQDLKLVLKRADTKYSNLT